MEYIPCCVYSKNGLWENNVGKELKIHVRRRGKYFGFYNEKDLCFLPFNYGKEHWKHIFLLTLSIDYRLDKYNFRYLNAAIRTPSINFIPKSFQEALVEVFALYPDDKQWLVQEIYKCTVLASLKKQELVFSVLNNLGYPYKAIALNTIKEAYMELGIQTDFTLFSMFYHFDCLSKRVSEMSMRNFQAENSRVPGLQNELLKVLYWAYDIITDIPSIETIDKYFYYFMSALRWRIIRKLFYEHKCGRYSFNLDVLETLLHSKRRFLLYHRIADTWFTSARMIPNSLSLELLLDSLKSYLERKTFLTFNNVLDTAIREASVYTPNVAVYPSSLLNTCNGGLRINSRFRGFAEVHRGEKETYFTLIPHTYIERIKDEGETQKCIAALLDQYAERLNDTSWKVDNNNVEIIKHLEHTLCRWTASVSDEDGYRQSKELSGNYLVNYSEINKTIKSRTIGFGKLCYPSLSRNISPVVDKYFLWCGGRPCFRNNLNLSDDWRRYKIIDILHLLGHDVTECKEGHQIGNEAYNRFADVLAKAQRIIEKLKCAHCGHLLFPVRKSNSISANEYSRYCCENEQCPEYKKEIYLNHCYSCRDGVIDSRETRKCPHGMYICPSCFSCCSNQYFERMAHRYTLAQTPIPTQLKELMGKGHLDSKVRFCPKCGKQFSTSLKECPYCKYKKPPQKYNGK